MPTGIRGGIAVAALDDIPAQQFGVPALDDAEQPNLAFLHGDDVSYPDLAGPKPD
jgi:hypothetical protein